MAGLILLPGLWWILIYVHVPCGGSIEYKIKWSWAWLIKIIDKIVGNNNNLIK